ncbi:MAG: hypothetical protein DMG15_29285 [Acidobacteria bacterium]|nr:MAG: hypothetical protein DMG15_29285 [Acidobacteriota bacterium]
MDVMRFVFYFPIATSWHTCQEPFAITRNVVLPPISTTFEQIGRKNDGTAEGERPGNRKCLASNNAAAKRAPQNKARNLLDRLRDFEIETLRPMSGFAGPVH